MPSGNEDLVLDQAIGRRLVSLAPGSVLWCCMLILILHDESRQEVTVVVLPDSVGEESFRALRIACQWIAGKGQNHEWT